MKPNAVKPSKLAKKLLSSFRRASKAAKANKKLNPSLARYCSGVAAGFWSSAQKAAKSEGVGPTELVEWIYGPLKKISWKPNASKVNIGDKNL